MPADGPVPNLRFPEFREAGPWEVKRLGDGIDLISGQHLGPDQYTNQLGGYPYFTGPSDFTHDRIKVTKWIPNEISAPLARKGDVLVTVKGSGVGELWRLSLSKVAMGRQLMAVRGVKFDSGFILYFLIQRRAHLTALAAGNMIPGLSRDDLLSLPIPTPCFSEQQKIADCLSSLDDLIRAEGARLGALRDHKRALMQRLFPRPGETTPRLRFPEFRKAGPWEVKRLGEVCEINPTGADLPERFVYIDLESVEAGELVHRKIISREGAPSRAQRVLSPGDIVFQMVRPYQKIISYSP